MRKIIICTITSLILMLTASYVVFANNTNESVPVTETENLGAVEIIASGTCGDDLTWELNSEWLLTISGTGDMHDYNTNDNTPPWNNYRSLVTKVYIDDNVSNIGAYAFDGYDSILEVRIGNAVTSIGKGAFSECGITKINIPDSVVTIYDFAFDDCDSLVSVKIGNGVVTIRENAFRDCRKLEEVFIGNNVETIGELAFSSCSALRTVVIPDSVSFIGERTFQFCNSLESAVIGKGLTKIEDNLFSGCRSLADITIGDNITSIGNYAFDGCKNLSNIKLPEGVTEIGMSAFIFCEKLVSIKLPKALDVIMPSTFYGCYGLEEVEFNEGLTLIHSSAFSDCNSLKSIVIPDSVTRIQGAAFFSCDNINTVKLGKGLISIGDYAFSACFNLKSIVIPDNVTSIGVEAFYNCVDLEDVSIGRGVVEISYSTFEGCSSIRQITVGEGVRRIEKNAFRDCVALEHILIGKGVTWISEGAFESCKNLKEIIVDEKNEYFNSEGGVLFNKDKTEVIKYPEGKGDKTYEVPSGVTKIRNYAFYKNDNIEEVVALNSVMTIGLGAFCECTNLKNVTLSKNLTHVETSAFYGCDNLSKVHYLGTRVQLEALPIGDYNESLMNADIHYECEYKETVSTNSEKGHTYGLYCPECGWLSGEDIGFLITVSDDEIADIEYTGAPIEPEITITQGDRILEEGRDYELTYSNNIDAGTAEVEIKGIGDFSGVVTKTFDIIPKDVTGLVEWEIASWDSAGYTDIFDLYNHFKRNLTITLNGTKLLLDKDYGVSFSYDYDIDKPSNFSVTFRGNYEGKITKYSLESAIVKKIPVQHYIGSELKPTIVVQKRKGFAETHTEGVDYRVEYSNNIEIGTATVKIFPLGDCYGSTEATFEITDHEYYWKVDKPATVDDDGTKSLYCYTCGLIKENERIPKVGNITFDYCEYTGGGHVPSATVKDVNGNTLGKESFSIGVPVSAVKVGRHRVNVTFKGEYSGKKETYFYILPKAPKTATAKLRTATGGYDDVKFSWSKSTGASGYYVYCKKSTDKEYTYLTRTTTTSYTKKNLTDGVKYYFKVVPYYKDGDDRYASRSYKTVSIYTLKKISTPKLSKSGTRVKVSWTNINGETGYQISKSTKKSGTNIVSTYKTTKGTYKKIKASKGKKYYYKVRAYKVVDGKKVYGPWSTAKAYKR